MNAVAVRKNYGVRGRKLGMQKNVHANAEKQSARILLKEETRRHVNVHAKSKFVGMALWTRSHVAVGDETILFRTF